MQPPLVSLHTVARRYGRRWALAGINLELPRGSRLLVTGANGAGKSTLLHVVATLLKPSCGKLCLFGEGVGGAAGAPAASRSALRRRLGLMAHQHHLYEGLTGFENLLLVSGLAPWPPASPLVAGAAQAIAEVLDQVGLGRAQAQELGTYSAGMKRRLVLAQLLLRAPELVLLDEPFGQLDPEGVALMEKSLQAMAERGVTWLLATHDVERGAALCTSAVHLCEGRFEASSVALPSPSLSPVDSGP